MRRVAGLSELQLHYQTMCKQVDQKKNLPYAIGMKSIILVKYNAVTNHDSCCSAHLRTAPAMATKS